jgi:hypothetical protein
VASSPAAALVQLDVGRYAIVNASGASPRQVLRALEAGEGVRMLDPRIEAFGVRAGTEARAIDVASGAHIDINGAH